MKNIFVTILVCIAVLQLKAQDVKDTAQPVNLPNVEGKLVSLQSLKGKVVILDFWASWCGPCKPANVELKKLYKKYKAKGLEIYSVSIDDDEDRWKAAIKKQGLNWLQVISPGGWASVAANAWGVEAIPANFIIDKNGVIRAIELSGKKLENKIKNLLKE